MRALEQAAEAPTVPAVSRHVCMVRTMGHEPLIRLGGFLLVFALMASWELVAPLRPLTTFWPKRWFANLGMAALDTLAVRVLFPTAAVGVAYVASERGWGALHLWRCAGWLEVLIAVVFLDLVLYLQHVMFHTIPLLWRLHMVHHADLDVDVTTGARFHPLEILVSMVVKLGAVVMIGASPMAVLTFEVLLNATSMFNHSNVHMPPPVERVLRWILVTPDMHRIHHSAHRRETNSNFGFNLPWWDRLMGTFLAEPSAGHMGMALGLEQFREPDRLTLSRILVLPFVGETGSYPIAGGQDGGSKGDLHVARPGGAPSSSAPPR